MLPGGGGGGGGGLHGRVMFINSLYSIMNKASICIKRNVAKMGGAIDSAHVGGRGGFMS